MANKKRSEICEDFRRQYLKRMKLPTNLTSERITIIENLERLHRLVRPEVIPRARSTKPEEVLEDELQDELGRFRSPRIDKKCVTDDMDIIRFYTRRLKEEPPSFIEAGPRRDLYHHRHRVRVAILTSGGIAPGLNTVVESIVRRHVEVYGLLLTRSASGTILGFHDGFVGLEADRYKTLYPDDVKGWCRFGGSRLGVGRGTKAVDKWLQVLKRHKIDIVYVIGGNGSLTGAWELAKAVKKHKLNLSIGVVPKTMDNDILWVWQSFGFSTAFDRASEIINVLHTEARSCCRVCVIQLFGADSGHVASNAALSSGDVDAVLIPEQDFEIPEVCKHVVLRVSKDRHALIVMAEGARGIERNSDGQWRRWSAETSDQKNRNFHRMQEALRDALSKEGLERYKVFGNQPRHVIRSVSPNSHDQVYCNRLADMVVDSCLGGYTNFMISSWLTEYVLVPLVFAAKGGLTKEGCKTFPTGGIFWRTVLRSTVQPSFLSNEVREAIRNGEVRDEEA